MNCKINSEDFDLTDSIRTQIEDRLQKISSHMKKECYFNVFLSKSSQSEYEVKIETQYQSSRLLGHSKGKEFYAALSRAKKALLRQVDDINSKKRTGRTSS